MQPLVVLSIIGGSLNLVESLLPFLDHYVATGQITKEQQQAILDKYQSLKKRADGQFSGPQWQRARDREPATG